MNSSLTITSQLDIEAAIPTGGTIVSGIKPTGRPHLGNYFGAIRSHLELQRHPRAYFFVANLHALTTLRDPELCRAYSFGVALDYLALGLESDQATLYLQSDVPETTELAWVFSTLISVPELQRGVSYKDTRARREVPNGGLLMYPVLQAADILLQRGTHVPVGRDQRQHVEVARELARAYNRTYGELFPEPEAIVDEATSVVPGIDGRKMSKSYGNTIGLFDEGPELRSKVMSIVTDSTVLAAPKDPEQDNVFALIRLVADSDHQAEIAAAYRAGGYGYGAAKQDLLQLLTDAFAEARERRRKLERDPDYVLDILREGGRRARESAAQIMEQVREQTGLVG